MLTKNINLQLAFYLIIAFIVFTVVGTISHELGHWIVAKILGYNASIHYGYTFSGDIQNSGHAFLITLGGPLQTALTGTIGVIILVWQKKRFYARTSFNIKQWLVVFMALFWLRPLFNFVQGMLVYFIKGYFPNNNDEVRLATELGINQLSISLSTAIVASCIVAFVIFKFIPIQQRLTFIISGFMGGVLGFYLWLHLIGPVVMP